MNSLTRNGPDQGNQGANQQDGENNAADHKVLEAQPFYFILVIPASAYARANAANHFYCVQDIAKVHQQRIHWNMTLD